MNKLSLLLISLAAIAGLTVATPFVGFSAIPRASAASNCDGFLLTDTCYCYTSAAAANKICFENKGECNKAQRSDSLASSGCFRQK